MRYHAILDLGELTSQAYVHLVEAYAAINLDYLRRHPQTTPLYRTRIRYVWEPWVVGANGKITRPPDIWRDMPAMIASGMGNCKDMVAERLAELRLAGKSVRPVVLETKLPDGRSLSHVIIEWVDTGAREDPSLQMGMPANQIDLATARFKQLQSGLTAPGSNRAAVGQLLSPRPAPPPWLRRVR